MKLLTIGYDKDLLDPTSGAAARHRAYAAHLEALHVIVLSRAKDTPETVELGENVYAHKTGGGSPFAVLQSAFAIGKAILGEEGTWVISAQDPFECALVGVLLRRATGTSLQIQEHGDFFSRPYWRRESLMNRARYMLGRMLLPRADCVRAVSERIQRTLVRCGVKEERITVVPVYTELAAFRSAVPDHGIEALRPEGGTLILSMARFVPQKNLCLLLRAFRHVLAAESNVRLVLVGQGADKQRLLAHASDLMPDKVTFIDWTNNPAGALKAADLYALSSDYEGWGRVCVEALATGTPLVMTDVGCAQEVVCHEVSGLVVGTRDEAALREGMLRLVRDHTLRKQLVAGGTKALAELRTEEACIALYIASIKACARYA